MKLQLPWDPRLSVEARILNRSSVPLREIRQENVSDADSRCFAGVADGDVIRIILDFTKGFPDTQIDVYVDGV